MTFYPSESIRFSPVTQLDPSKKGCVKFHTKKRVLKFDLDLFFGCIKVIFFTDCTMDKSSFFLTTIFGLVDILLTVSSRFFF